MASSCPKLFEIYIVKLLCSSDGVKWKMRDVVNWRDDFEGKQGVAVNESVASIDWVHKYDNYKKESPPKFDEMQENFIYYPSNTNYPAIDAAVKTSKTSISFFQMKRLQKTDPCLVNGIMFS